MDSKIDKQKIERAVIKVSEEIEKKPNCNKNWKQLSETQLFTEIVSCILGSKVKFEIARDYTNKLKCQQLLVPLELIRRSKFYEDEIYSALSNPTSNKVMLTKRYPYPRSKASFILRTAVEVYGKSKTSLKKILSSCESETVARCKLVSMCCGIGFKQASLFLTNVGFAENLAILDSHVLNYMKIQGMCDSESKAITKKQYLNHEQTLISYANSFNQSLAKLDFAIWIVMRVLRGQAQWE